MPTCSTFIELPALVEYEMDDGQPIVARIYTAQPDAQTLDRLRRDILEHEAQVAQLLRDEQQISRHEELQP